MTTNPFDPDYVEPEHDAVAPPPPKTILEELERGSPTTVGGARPASTGHITYHTDVEQGSIRWHELRCGLLTASEMKLIVSEKTFKAASNDKERTHLYELLAQRVTQFVEPQYLGWDMERGHEEEVEARILYSKTYAPVTEVGFITNTRHGFTLGYSPDGLVGEHGQIEAKSRRQKYQFQTIIEHVAEQTIPSEHLIQVQTGLIVSEREWCDFLSYSNGLPMVAIRVYPDRDIQEAIVEAADAFETRLREKLKIYEDALASDARLTPTKRKIYEDISV